jgi:hypothetical protein
MKKILKRLINRRFVDIFDKNDKEHISLENIFLLGPYGIPITSNLRIIYSSLGTIDFAKKRLRYTIKEFGVLKIIIEFIKVRYFKKNNIKETLGFLIPRAGWPELPNYGHYLCEDLPKIKTYKDWEIKNNKKLKLLLGPISQRAWLPKFMKLFEYEDKDLFNNSELFLRLSKLVMAKLYYIHSFSFQSNPEGIKWVGNELKNKVLKGEKLEKVNIFIDRSKIYRRHVINYDELLPVLNRYNFISLNPEDYTVEEQIELFSRAKIIAGPTGAAFSNMIFAKNATIVYSWNIMDKVNCWQNLSKDMGFKFIPVKTKAVEEEGKTYTNLDLIINKNHFEESIISALNH